jgi:hypothetical protein
MKLIYIQSKSLPSDPGYHDFGMIVENFKPGIIKNKALSATANIIWRGIVSAQPNPNMFCLLNDERKKRMIWKLQDEMDEGDKYWCKKCTRKYCKNYRGSSTMDPHIDCRLCPRIAYTEHEADYYPGVFIANHQKFGRCILLNNGGKIPSLTPNSEHDGEYWCKEIFIHKGYAEMWEGSLGCITVPPGFEFAFFSVFHDGEKVKIAVVDFHHKGEV